MPTRINPNDLQAPTRYNWAELLDGSTWKMEAGVDFDCDPYSLGRLARKRAEERNLAVKVSINIAAGEVLLRARPLHS